MRSLVNAVMLIGTLLRTSSRRWAVTTTSSIPADGAAVGAAAGAGRPQKEAAAVSVTSDKERRILRMEAPSEPMVLRQSGTVKTAAQANQKATRLPKGRESISLNPAVGSVRW